jgi:hypothetical protein
LGLLGHFHSTFHKKEVFWRIAIARDIALM